MDVFKKAHRVIHSGVRYIDRHRPQPDSFVPAKTELDDAIYPSDHITYNSVHGYWEKIPLFPEAPMARLLKGKTFSIILPLEIAGQRKEYNFVFMIKDVFF